MQEKVENNLVKEIEAEVEKARKHEEWRNEYMTLLMRDEEKREEGKMITLFSLVKKGILTIEQAATEAMMSVTEFTAEMNKQL